MKIISMGIKQVLRLLINFFLSLMDSTYLGLISNCGLKRANLFSSLRLCACVLMKCRADAISGTMMTQGCESRRCVVRTSNTLPAKFVFKNDTNSST